MKDGFMILVLLLVMITPMFPILLKGKCPKCNKRKLEKLETETHGEGRTKTYVTGYHCHACKTDFKQNKSGPLKVVVAKTAAEPVDESTNAPEPALAKSV